MPISDELRKQARHYRDSMANIKAEEAKVKAEEQRKKAEQERREKAKQDREIYNRRLQESKQIIEEIKSNKYNPRQIRNSRNAKIFAENVAQNSNKQETIIDTKPILVNDEEQEELIAKNNNIPVYTDEEIQIAREQAIQQAEPVEQTPVEESITQPVVPVSTPVNIPFNAQDYQLGEYQVNNTIPNSSIQYIIPPIERKSLEMPQHNGEQVSSIKDFLSGVSTITAYIYHNKVVPFIDETREKLFGPSEEELARRAAEEEQERLRLEEEARIAREQFVQDSINLDLNQRTEDILAKIAAMDTSYVVGRYNGRNLVSGIATPGSRFIGTNRKQKTNVKGYNILAPWNNWAVLDKNTTDKSIEDNHFIEGNKHEKRGNINPAVARYITITNDGNLMFTDTIPRGVRGQITTGYASTGNLSNSFKKNKSIRNIEVVHPDGTKSYPIFSWLNPYNLNSVYHPVQAAVLFDLPNGEKSWVISYGRTANQFYNDVSKIKNITGDDELEFVNFDSRSATGAYGDAGIRYNKFGSYPSLILRRKFGGDIRRSLAKGGRKLEPDYTVQLPEISVNRAKDPLYILANENPDAKDIIYSFYDNKDRSQIDRLLEVYENAGRPTIHLLPEGKTRAYITAGNGHIYVDRNNAYDDIIAELAHPIQEKYGNNDVFREIGHGRYTYYDNDDYKGKTRYDFPETFEHETHFDFEPLLKDYIQRGILPGQRFYTGYKGLGNHNIVYNPSFEQIMDSARVYNKRKQDTNYTYDYPLSMPYPKNRGPIGNILKNMLSPEISKLFTIEKFLQNKKEKYNYKRSLAKGGRLKARNGKENQQTNIIDLIRSKRPVTYQEIVNAAELAHSKEVQKEKALNEKNVESADYTTQSNDNTIVVNNNPNIQQEYNTHLPEFEGDPLVWDKEHPNLASWRNLVSASPYIIASVPLAAGVSGAAGTIGNAIAKAATASRFAPIAQGIGTGIKWLNRGLTAGLAGHGAYNLSKGNFTPQTALELVGAGNSLANYYWNVETRAIEAAMRTGSTANPLSIIGANINDMLKGNAGGKKRLYNIGKYILTGAKTGNKGYYNSFAYNPSEFYGGFITRRLPKLTATTENDIIDAALYGKTIDPAYGMRKVAVGKDFGFHTGHIKEVYPDKLKNIQVYELNTPIAVPENIVPRLIGRPQGAPQYDRLFRTEEGPVIDAGGHIEQFGKAEQIPYGLVKAEDIWAFNPNRYKSKYINRRLGAGDYFLVNFGLDRVYKHVTPVISKAKWQRGFISLQD